MNKYPLTEAQKRIWFNEQIYPGTPINNIGGFVRIKGTISFSRLQEAIFRFIELHEGLRIQLLDSEEPLQLVSDSKPTDIQIYDFSLYLDKERMFNEWVQEEAKKPFHLYNSPLFRFAFFHLGTNDNGYLIKLHHIIADMWSVSLLTNQIRKFYEYGGNDQVLAHVPTYLDYIFEEQEYLNSKRCAKDRDFWLNKFSNLQGFSGIRSNNPNSKRLTFTVDELLSKEIQDTLKQTGLSLNSLFIGLTTILFYLKKGKKQQLFGIPIFNRSNAQQKQTFGMYISTLPFLAEVEAGISLIVFLNRIKSCLSESYQSYKYPFNLLVSELASKGIDLVSLMSTSINFYFTKHPLDFSGNPVVNEEFFRDYQNYPLHIVVHEWEAHSIKFHLDYQIDSYEEKEILDMASDLLTLLSTTVKSPEVNVENIHLSSTKSTNRISYKAKNPSKHTEKTTITDLFYEMVVRYPNKIAIQEGKRYVTFAELNLLVDRLATSLIDMDENEGVGVIGHPSVECVVSMLAILKAGSFFVPFHPNENPDRIKECINKTSVRKVLLCEKLDINLGDTQIEAIDVRELLLTLKDAKGLDSQASADKLAYVIFTSGSTGNPKGVSISHSNLMAYLDWARIYLESNQKEVFAFYTSIAFDLTITSIFLPLITGSTIKVFHEAKEYALSRIVRDSEVTVIKATPSHLELIPDHEIKNTRLRCLIVGGENLKTQLAHKLQHQFGTNLSIYNEYGPTETTVGCMTHIYNEEKDLGDSVPIGYAAGSNELLVLNDHGYSVEPHEIGELYVTGDQTALGYYNEPKLTALSFLKLGSTSNIYYKTGDLVFENEYGELVFAGRKDDQLKISGFRVELKEIELSLSSFPNIEAACVIHFQDLRNPVLAAFFVCNKPIEHRLLLSFLEAKLPSYKLPTFYQQIDQMPLNLNGKIDKKKLSALYEKSLLEQAFNGSDLRESVLNTIESTLKQKIGNLEDSYYQLGGNSIKAIQIASRLASRGIELSVRNILSAQSINAMLSSAKAKKDIGSSIEPSTGIQPRSSIFKWFFNQNFKHPHFYHHSVSLDLKQSFRLDQLESCLRELINYHDTLRLGYDPDSKAISYSSIIGENRYKVQAIDLTHANPDDTTDIVNNLAYKMKDATDLSQGILLSAALCFLANGKQKLIICVHHFAVDGISWHILLDDLNELLNACRTNKRVKLGLNTNTFQSWVKTLENINREYTSELQKYLVSIPKPKYPLQVLESLLELRFALSKEDTELLQSISEMHFDNQMGSLIACVYLSTLSMLLSKNSISIFYEYHGREIPDTKINLSRTLGWFTVMCPLHVVFSGEIYNDLDLISKNIELLKNHAHQFALSNPWLEANLSPFQFNFIGELSSKYSEFDIERLAVGPERHPQNLWGYMDLTVYQHRGVFHHMMSMPASFNFSPQEFKKTYNIVLKNIFKAYSTKNKPRKLDFEKGLLDQNELEEIFL
jgi:amino acid adenylation domain-containing protein